MAEAYFNYLADKNHLSGSLKAISAGTRAYPGDRASEQAVESSLRFGIDISTHSSRPISYELVLASDWILTMTEKQKKEVLEQFPKTKGKLFTIKEFVNKTGDIEDPIGTTSKIYETIYKEIIDTVEMTFERIKTIENSDRQ